MNNISRLAVIPARKGSTRFKDKNIHLLAGKPLIRWITESVVESSCFDRILVSTDSDQIFSVVEDLKVERHIRPCADATEKATALNAMLNLMEQEKPHDIFAYFLPTCPFISSDDIRLGVERLSYEVDSVISMTPFSETIQLACIMKNDQVIPVFDNLTSGLTNSKFIQKYCRPSGAFYMSWWDNLIKRRNFFTGEVKGVLIPAERSVDINTPIDIEYAQKLIELRN